MLLTVDSKQKILIAKAMVKIQVIPMLEIYRNIIEKGPSPSASSV